LQSDRSILLECRIPATNRETLARFSPQTGCLARTSADAPATGTCGSYVMVAVAAYGRMSETPCSRRQLLFDHGHWQVDRGHAQAVKLVAFAGAILLASYRLP